MENNPRPGGAEKPGCVFQVVVGWITTVTCMFSTLWCGEWAQDQALDHPWVGPVGLLVLITTWIGGTVVLMGLLTKWWLKQYYGRVVGVVALELCCLATFIALLIYLSRPHGHYDTVFADHRAEYLALEPEGTGSNAPVLKGRCVVVRQAHDGHVTFYCMTQIPPALRAETPEQVETVIQLRYGKKKLASPPEAEVDSCEITVIERKTRRLLGKHTFVGQWRQVARKNKDKVWIGSVEENEVFQWLRALPRE